MENKKYFLTVNGENVEVSKEIFKFYRSESDKVRYQNKKIKDNNVLSYNYSLKGDNEELNVEETIADTSNVSLDDDIFNNISKRELLLALEKLTEDELSLIKSIYFFQNSDRNYSRISGIKQTTVSYRKKRILKKLKILLEIV